MVRLSLQRADQLLIIGLKMNSLTDKRIIEKLMEASQAGVDVNWWYVEAAA